MFTHLIEKVCKNKLVRRIISVALVLATVLCVNGIVFAKTVSTDGTYSAHVDYLTVIDGKWEVVATQDKLHRQGNNYKDRYYDN